MSGFDRYSFEQKVEEGEQNGSITIQRAASLQ